MSKYIKEWLFCESGDCYKLSEIDIVFTYNTIKEDGLERGYYVLHNSGKEYKINNKDYIEIINALKEREKAIAELLEVDIDEE